MSRRPNTINENPATPEEATYIEILNKLCEGMPRTIADRIIALTLLSAGVEDKKVSEIVGIKIRQIHTLKKSIKNGTSSEFLSIKSGQGRKPILADFEEEIFEEIENNGTYSTRKEIADMIEDKYQIRVSENTISRLLKKGASRK